MVREGVGEWEVWERMYRKGRERKGEKKRKAGRTVPPRSVNPG